MLRYFLTCIQNYYKNLVLIPSKQALLLFIWIPCTNRITWSDCRDATAWHFCRVLCCSSINCSLWLSQRNCSFVLWLSRRKLDAGRNLASSNLKYRVARHIESWDTATQLALYSSKTVHFRHKYQHKISFV